MGFKCAKCARALYDSILGIIICNGCGPYSTTRYCNRACLFVDVLNHFCLCGLEPLSQILVDWNKLPEIYRKFMLSILKLSWSYDTRASSPIGLEHVQSRSEFRAPFQTIMSCLMTGLAVVPRTPLSGMVFIHLLQFI